MLMKVEFYKHDLGQQELDSLSTVLDSVFLTTGPRTRELEKKLALFLHCADFIAVSSCTQALVICLKALDIGPGDEVLTTPLTFIASSNSILEVGATPVFVDVEPRTGNLDAELIEAAITPRTKAILPVHLYGQMADMRSLQAIADQYNLQIIEDAAHCLEGQREGIRPGHLSAAACFSFYATKSITCGEGGGIAVNDQALAQKIKLLRTHGMNKEASERYQGRYQHWDMPYLGYKANLDDIRSALLLPQLDRIKANLATRQRLSRVYEQGLQQMAGIDFPETMPGVEHARHLFTIWVDPEKRDTYLAQLPELGVGVAVNYRPVHLLSYYCQTFGYKKDMFPRAEAIGSRTISLPLYPALTEQEIEYVLEVLNVMH